ncbi:MAG TPA: endopeptidase La [Methanoregulaceae archaeon]|nr:MAG: endopeptidase La [Methanolinea sp.]HON82225.1 endopeptidase La [Methanoregulaceae archaeon]HPD09973.1 endopeptidase La [Methanoregulaceae archaeon]HRT14976.1 endopeptidase La [Methanoregulaceae archaeon]HRU30549.1 endopeptidase La [Methanoregulaceae archaeon]
MFGFNTPRNPELLVIPLSGIVVFPLTRTRLNVEKPVGQALAEALSRGGPAEAIAIAESGDAGEPKASLFPVGCLVKVMAAEPSDEGYVIDALASRKARVVGVNERDGRLYATWAPFPDRDDLDEPMKKALLAEIRAIIHDISSHFKGAAQFTHSVNAMESVDQVMGYVLLFAPVATSEKQAILETESARERARMFLDLLGKVREHINFRVEMAQKVSEKVHSSNREAMLREQLKLIQEELNEIEGGVPGDSGYRERIEQSKMPEEVRKKALSEARKLEGSGGQNHEGHIIRNYLDLLLDLPWVTEEKNTVDIAEARKVLDANHTGLEKVKERIIQHLAVMKLKHEKQGSILLLTGPPGTGKTSLGRSIADALGRKYVRVSLGGVRDEAEIRGHRRTYVGALPGRIIQGIRRAGVKNPVFILDEVDKLGFSHLGDPASALLEVLDPEQNNTFSDHYLEVPYDLSEVLFIATANTTATIPAPLLDRMELIEIPGYTKNEKFSIARNHLIPEVLDEHGLDAGSLEIRDDALRGIVERYTREAGVRWLKKQLARVARYASEKIVSGRAEKPFVVCEEMLDTILGREVVRQEAARKVAVPGVVTGLAWTPVGGEILFIEGTAMPGKGRLTLTGQLGDVMKESATISMSLARSRLAYKATGFDFIASDVHIHVPSGATPKDGPSAGIALFAALASLITGTTVDPKTAMTGEITLSGAVLPVGGIREKVLAAHRAGIRTIILPGENRRDLEDVPEEARDGIRFVFVDTIDQVLKEALGLDLQESMVPFPARNCVIPVGNI